jgi:hypothetical protein
VAPVVCVVLWCVLFTALCFRLTFEPFVLKDHNSMTGRPHKLLPPPARRGARPNAAPFAPPPRCPAPRRAPAPLRRRRPLLASRGVPTPLPRPRRRGRAVPLLLVLPSSPRRRRRQPGGPARRQRSGAEGDDLRRAAPASGGLARAAGAGGAVLAGAPGERQRRAPRRSRRLARDRRAARAPGHHRCRHRFCVRTRNPISPHNLPKISSPSNPIVQRLYLLCAMN